MISAFVAAVVLAVEPAEWVVRLENPPQGPAFAVSADGVLFAVARDTNWIDIYSRGEIVNAVRGNDGDQVCALAFSPDGKFLAAGCSTSNQVRVWGVPTGQMIFSASAGEAGVRSLAFAPNGKLLFSGGEEGDVRAWDAATGAERFAWQDRPSRREGVTALAVHPGGRRLAAATTFDPAAHSWCLATHRREPDFLGTFSPREGAVLAFSPNGRSLAFAGQASVVVVETASRERRWAKDAGSQVASLAWSDDGRFLAAALDSGAITVYDEGGKRVVQHRTHAGRCLQIAAGGGKIVSLGADKTVRVRDWPQAGGMNADDADAIVREAGKALVPVSATAASLRAEVAKCVRELAADDFDARERASRMLRELVPRAGLEIANAQRAATDPEVTYRLRRLLAEAKMTDVNPPVTVAEARWLERLERVNTPAARGVVQTLTRGEPDADLTLDAVDTLARMNRNRRPDK